MRAVGTSVKRGGKYHVRLVYQDADGHKQDIRRRFATKTEADEFLQATKREISAGGGDYRTRESMTVAQLVELYLADVAVPPYRAPSGELRGLVSWRNEHSYSKPVTNFLGKVRLRNLKEKHLRDLLRHLVSEPKSATDPSPKRKAAVSVNKIMKCFRRILNWGREPGQGYLSSSPFDVGRAGRRRKGQSFFLKEKSRKVRLTLAQERAILERCDADPARYGFMRAAILLLLETSGRVSEIIDARWSQLETGEAGRKGLRIIATKTADDEDADERLIILSDLALEQIAWLAKHSTGEHIFPAAEQYTYAAPAWGEKLWNELRAGVADEVQLRDLRRESASRLVEAGVPLPWVSRHLGHKSIRTTEIYLALDSDARADIADAFAAYRKKKLHESESEGAIN